VALSAHYLADKSALARFQEPSVADRLTPLLEEGLIATCAIIDLELLYSARSPRDYESILEERGGLEDAPITTEVLATAKALQRSLARSGRHRVPIPDLLISAAARHAGLVVIHYDSDFEVIAGVGGAVQEWVVPRGSV
jgi:predicted nucleic acid-binding protein